MQIEDGIGNGFKAKVTNENLLSSDCITTSIEHHTNHDHKTAYHIVFVASGIIDNTAFLYIKNTDDTDMIIEGFRLHTECDAKVIVVKDPTITTVTGNTNTPANVNLGAGLVADGVFTTAMSGAISGCTGGTTIDRAFYCSGCADKLINFEMDVIVPKNKELALFTECCSGCNIGGLVPIYFHSD